ncbi:hypothetical protein LKL35_32875 [Streptomyces sp. ET3-23]|uniref:hypothetical protein n=1 Tax=Streptomyces sp. ET3-23 TaxID=2885643 RepID=UPI001D12BE91|nr:hypothetical protein [Streptomyces sp. ET3-23]MCC2280178.1 hypothetical protein [Streptomyces sp. ET3-23]
MNVPRRTAPSRAGFGLPGLRRLTRTVSRLALAAAVLTAAAGCGGSHASSSARSADDSSRTVRDLGAVPIPPPPTAQATPTADEKHLQLVAVGSPVRAELPEATAVVRASGPTEDLPAPTPGSKPPESVTGTLTVTLDQATAPLTMQAGDFTSRDEDGKDITLTPSGAGTATATPGHPATLALNGTFAAGAAQLTWRHDGKTVAVWDFSIELD